METFVADTHIIQPTWAIETLGEFWSKERKRIGHIWMVINGRDFEFHRGQRVSSTLDHVLRDIDSLEATGFVVGNWRGRGRSWKWKGETTDIITFRKMRVELLEVSY